MARTFYPRKTRLVPASEPHVAGTEYKISVGDEDWGNGTYQPVVKVQMVYDGKVAGRKSPSYPVGSGDWKKVQMVIDELVEDEEGQLSKPNVYMMPVMLTKDGILSQLEEIISLTEDRPSSEKTRYLDVHTGFISYKMTGIFEYAFYHLTDDLKLLCDVNTVQERLKQEEERKANGVYSSSREHFMHGKLFCGDCGMPMTRRTIKYHGKQQKVWKCKGRLKDCKSCKNDVISEEDLFRILSEQLEIKWKGMEAVTEKTFARIQKVVLYGDGRIEIEMEDAA